MLDRDGHILTVDPFVDPIYFPKGQAISMMTWYDDLPHKIWVL